MNEKPPPHDIDAEKSVLCSMMDRPEIYLPRANSEGLIPSTFYHTGHRMLFEAFLELSGQDKPIELVSLSRWLLDENRLNGVGGPSYLAEISGNNPTHAHFSEHLAIVKEMAALRKADALNANISTMIEEGATWEEVVREIEANVDDIKSTAAVRQCFVNALQAMDSFMAAIRERMDSGDIPGIPTGIRELDLIGGGMRKGEFWVICGETSSGKSAMSYQMLLPAINEGGKVLIFTLEMGNDEVFSRLVSCRGRVDLGKIMNPKGISRGDIKAIKTQAQALAQSGLLICDEANMSIDYICAQCEIEAEKGPIAAVCIDYIQLVDGGNRRGENREQELSRISKRMKQLAKKLNCPVISPAQLNDDGRLRESRGIGMDADVLLKIKADGVSVDKFRNAPRDQFIRLGLVGKYQRFETLSQ